MLNFIKKGLKIQQEIQYAGYPEIFGKNTKEVIAVTNAVYVLSTVQWVSDWKRKGFKKAMTNNAVIAVGLMGYYIVKVPVVENKIATTLESLSDRIKQS